MSNNTTSLTHPMSPTINETLSYISLTSPGDVNVTNVTTTSTPGFFDPAVLSDAWEKNKYTVGWLIPVIVAIVVLLALLALGMVYFIRGVELWVLKCCHETCGCFLPNNSSHSRETEYTALTEALHGGDVISLADFEKGEEKKSHGEHSRKQE